MIGSCPSSLIGFNDLGNIQIIAYWIDQAGRRILRYLFIQIFSSYFYCTIQ